MILSGTFWVNEEVFLFRMVFLFFDKGLYTALQRCSVQCTQGRNQDRQSQGEKESIAPELEQNRDSAFLRLH